MSLDSDAAEDNIYIPNFDTKEHVQTLLLFFLTCIVMNRHHELTNRHHEQVCAYAVAGGYAFALDCAHVFACGHKINSLLCTCDCAHFT